MTRRVYEHGARAVLSLAAVSAAVVIAVEREPARASSPAPSGSASAAVPAPEAAAEKSKTRAPGVFRRLTDELLHARIDVPNLAKVDSELDYWRRMRSPWVKGGEAARAVQEVSLVRSGGKAKVEAFGGGHGWAPDPHVWNMNDGSFDQREVLLAPAPANYTFPLTLPKGATFESAVTIVGPAVGGVEFQLIARADGNERVLLTHRIDGSSRASFEPLTVDLSAYGEKSIELVLSTRALAPGPITPVGAWATPTIFAPESSDLPFNVLYIVVDALRADAISAFHDAETDAKMASANPPPLDAWLPSLPEVAPNLDELAKRGVAFTSAFSAATWTRPGTLAMLAGEPSSHLGLSALPLVPAPADVRAMYARRPPFLPLLLRPHGALTEAIVNNFYMTGYAGVGVDFGFESLVDHRYPLQDTQEILKDAEAALERDKSRRFFMFVNFVSPHVPYQPPSSATAAIPEPPRSPADKIVRAYLAEIHKDDAAIGGLVTRLGELGLSDNTLIIVTGDHGETLSVEHDAVPDGVDGGPQIGGRFHHLSSLYDETAHVPILMVLPKTLPHGKRIGAPVSTMDIAPTVCELLGVPRPDAVEGQSLVPLIHDAPPAERTILVEGRGAHSLRVGRYRLLLRDPEYRKVHTKGRHVDKSVELYDLETDPGERVDVAKQHPDIVERLRRLDQTKTPVTSGAGGAATDKDKAVVHLRIAGAGGRRRVTGRISAGNGAKLQLTPIAIQNEFLHLHGSAVDLEFDTPGDIVVGLDLTTEPPNADLEFALSLDGKPWPKEAVYAGTLGLAAPELVSGLKGDTARQVASAAGIPFIDADHDLGLFVALDNAGGELQVGQNDAAKQEAMGLMRAWGYVR